MRPARLVLALLLAACGADPAPASQAGPTGGDAAAAGGPGGPPGDGGKQTADLSLERLDASGDCAGMMPDAIPDPVTVRREPGAGETCGVAVGDGTGAVAIAAVAGETATWQAYAADGSPLGAFEAGARVVATPDGWHALVASGPGAAADLVAFSPAGAERRRTAVTPDPARFDAFRSTLAADPDGGSVVIARATHLYGNHWSVVQAHRFDASGAPRWPDGVPAGGDDAAREPYFHGGGASTRGEVLVVAQDSAFVDATWLAGDGHGLAAGDRVEPSDEVAGPGLSHALELVPLLDGAIAVRSDGTFRTTFRHLETAASPLPAWLAERAAASLRLTRGAAGYAALPPAGEASPDCTQRIDLLSPSGRLCGRVVLREPGGACTTGAVDQGWDGTVVQQSARDACVYRWWPGLLAR